MIYERLTPECVRIRSSDGRLLHVFGTEEEVNSFEDEVARHANRRNKKLAAERRKKRIAESNAFRQAVARGEIKP